MNKVVISAALTGAITSQQEAPGLPITPAEIADSAYLAWKAGAAIVHIHVRDDDGSPSYDMAKYRETIERIRAHKDCDVCINITSSGREVGDDEERIRPIRELLPELASYDCGSLNWQHRSVFMNPPSFLEKLGKELIDLNVKPEIEIFDAGMVYNAIHYMKTGILKAPCHFQIVLGAAGGMTNTVANLVHLHSILPEGCTWAGCGIGAGHMPIMMATIALGGHLRVGLEDNVFYHKGVLAESNAQLVARAKRLLEEAGLQAATPDEAREIYGLTRKVF
jgi:uncharacterized protein (DUF849 family)